MLGDTAIREEALLPGTREAAGAELELLMQPENGANLLEELLVRPAWHARAACRGLETEIFFPTDQITLTKARRICSHCPVSSECADFALAHPSLKGIWAGMSERRRARERKDANDRKREWEGVEDGGDAGGLVSRAQRRAGGIGRG